MDQRNRSSIVLLITLFFIFSISLLIIKNLKDSDQFINESELETVLIQAKISSKNIENEVVSLVKKNNDYIDNIVEITSLGIPLEYGNIKLNLTLNYYEYEGKCNLSDFNISQALQEQCPLDIVDNISYQYDFLELLKSYKSKYGKEFKSRYQVDYFIDDYIYQTRDETIDKIRENFSFLKDTNSTFLQCDYEMFIDTNKIDGRFVFTSDDENSTKKLFTLFIK